MLKPSLSGLLFWCLLGLMGLVWVGPIVRGFAPVIEDVVDALQSDYVAHLSLASSSDGTRLVMFCTATHDIYAPGRPVIHLLRSFPCAYVDAVHALAPIMIFLLPVIVWPWQRRGEVVGRVVASTLLLPVVVALTTPVSLMGLAQWSLYPDLANEQRPLIALLQPMAFVEMGGGWLIALLSATLCIACGKRLARSWRGGPAGGAAAPDQGTLTRTGSAGQQ